jgi:hypothetical protein
MPSFVPSQITDISGLASSLAAKPSSVGEKFRVAAQNAAAQNPWNRTYMFPVRGWQPGTAYLTRDLCVSAGKIYVCAISGTSSTTVTDAPSHVSATAQKEANGSVYWIYWKGNTVANGPEFIPDLWVANTTYAIGQFARNGNQIYSCTVAGTSASSGGPSGVGASYLQSGWITDGTASWTHYGAITLTWAQSTAYAVGDVVNVRGRVYTCVVAGTSASSGVGPTGTGNSISDGSVTWNYSGQYATSPYQNDYPVITMNFAGPLNNIYSPQTTLGQSVFTLRGAYLGANTSGVNWSRSPYTYTGTSFTITGDTTSGSNVITNVSSTSNITNTCILSGNGIPTINAVSTVTSNTITLRSDNLATATATGVTITVKPQTTSYYSIEFMTDAPKFTFYGGNNSYGPTVYIDGVRLNLAPLRQSTLGNATYTFDYSTTSNRKIRRVRIDCNGSHNVTSVSVDQQSQVWAVTDNNPIRAVFISDSIIAGSSYGPFIGGNNVAQRVACELGWSDPWTFAQGGTGYVNRGTAPGISTDKYNFRITEAAALNPDIWVLFGSTNDGGLSGIQAAVLSTLQSIRAVSSAPIVVVGVWSINSTGVSTTEAAVQAAVTQFADSKTWFVPVYGASPLPWLTGSWNNSANTSSLNSTLLLGGDNTHPVDNGTEYIALKIAAAIRNQVLPNL